MAGCFKLVDAPDGRYRIRMLLGGGALDGGALGGGALGGGALGGGALAAGRRGHALN